MKATKYIILGIATMLLAACKQNKVDVVLDEYEEFSKEYVGKIKTMSEDGIDMQKAAQLAEEAEKMGEKLKAVEADMTEEQKERAMKITIQMSAAAIDGLVPNNYSDIMEPDEDAEDEENWEVEDFE